MWSCAALMLSTFWWCANTCWMSALRSSVRWPDLSVGGTVAAVSVGAAAGLAGGLAMGNLQLGELGPAHLDNAEVELVGLCTFSELCAAGVNLGGVIAMGRLEAAELRPMHVCNLRMASVCSLQLSKPRVVRLYGVTWLVRAAARFLSCHRCDSTKSA